MSELQSADIAVRQRYRTHQLALVAVLATAAMLFTTFAASYLVRRSATDWRQASLPDLVWINTAVLALSSLTLEGSRRTGRKTGAAWALLLGGLFLAGQAVAWTQMGESGALAGPHGSFTAVMSAAHAVHVAGGLIALTAVVAKFTPERLALAAMYWHGMGLIWVGVLGVVTLL